MAAKVTAAIHAQERISSTRNSSACMGHLLQFCHCGCGQVGIAMA
jgi:hypothetical protein